MGAHSGELYNNLGLCCLYSQQLDLTLVCFQRALDLATDPLIKADVWYNLSHVAIVSVFKTKKNSLIFLIFFFREQVIYTCPYNA